MFIIEACGKGVQSPGHPLYKGDNVGLDISLLVHVLAGKLADLIIAEYCVLQKREPFVLLKPNISTICSTVL